MDGRQEAREQHSWMTPECLCAWEQDKGWQMSDSASAFVLPGGSSGVTLHYSTSDYLTPFPPTHLAPLF